MRSLTDLGRQFWEGRYFFLLVTLLCLGVYFNALGGEFVSDDIPTIVENPNLGNILLTVKQLNPLEFSKAIVFQLFGKSPIAYHVFNLILHLVATILVYFFILILTANDRLSTMATLLFALHPIHTEAVSWISGGAYIFYGVFFLLSFIFFHLYLESGRRFLYLLLATVLNVLSIAASGIWATPLLLVFFLYEWLVKKEKISWVFYLVGILVSIFYLWSAFRGGIAVDKIATGASVGGTKDPTITIPHSLVQYLYLLLWPLNLTIYHEGLVVSQIYVWLSRAAAVLIIFLIPLFLFWRKKKVALFFLLFFLVSISLSLSPIKIGWYVAERYLYLGSISFCVLLAAALLWVEEKLPVRNLALLLLLPLLLLYSLRIVVRNWDWQTQTSFWIATAQASPTSFRAWNNLGSVYGWQERWDKAIEAYQKSLSIKPNHDRANFNLGLAYFAISNLEEAKKHLLIVVKLNPRHHRAFYNLGLIYYEQGNFEEARKYWEQALRLNPNYNQAREGLDLLENE